MSRTREIKGWIYDNEKTIRERFPDNFDDMKGVSKATLIIELPERKVTISESEFDEATWGATCFISLKDKIFKDAE